MNIGSPEEFTRSCIVTRSVAETEDWGRRFGSHLKGGELVAISGVLGAGKTTLVRGIARGLGCLDVVASPTFILERHYSGRLPVLHVDLYRVTEGEASVRLIGDLALDDVLAASGVVLVEWGERLPMESYIPSLTITMETVLSDPAARRIRLDAPAEFPA